MTYLKTSVIFCIILFSSCCHQYNKKSTDPADGNELQPAKLMKELNEKKLSPGTAQVVCTITDLPDNNSHLKVRIKSIPGYGMATKPIAPGTEMEIFIPEKLKGILKEKDIQQGEELNLIISQERPMHSEDINWTVVDILN